MSVRRCVDQAVRAHHGELGDVLDRVAVLDLDDDGGHLADEFVEAAGDAALVDLREVLLEEGGVLLVAERRVVQQVHVDHVSGCVFGLIAEVVGKVVG